MTLPATTIAQSLISFDSVSSNSNAAVADWMANRLQSSGFEVERLSYQDTANIEKVCIVAKRGPGVGGIAYFCHNDVVPVDGWKGPYGGPFQGIVADDRLWGRGSCDMKGSAAAALAAIEQINVRDQHRPIYYVATSDEEIGMAGARCVDSSSRLFAEMVEHQTVGLVGEPTSLEVVHAHKGGYYLTVTSHGRAAHSSTREGCNANWALIPFLQDLRQLHLQSEADTHLQNSMYSPPTLSMNVIQQNEPLATNVTVAKSTCTIFLRPMQYVPWQPFVQAIIDSANQHGLSVAPPTTLNSLYTSPDRPFVRDVLRIAEKSHTRTVCYATDGGYFQRLKDLVVIGPGNIDQAHCADEWISLTQLKQGTETFEKLLRTFAC